MNAGTETGAGAALALDAVAFAYPGATAMRFDLAILAGEVVAVMGPSGSGKTTLLSLIAGFEEPADGTIRIGGEDVTRLPPGRRPVSMILQENNLFAHLDVEANVGLGRSPSLRLTAKDAADIDDALVRVGLAGKQKRLPRELSGGERQRVALARVLVRDRPVLLLDEAFASLGPALRDEMLDLVAEFHALRGMTVVMVTHDPRDARRLASRVAFVEAGRIAEDGPADELLSAGGSAALERYLGSGGETGR